jgi:predicted nucleic acid-binding protein
VPEAWVVNASPVILYARIGRLDLIEALAPRVIIPPKSYKRDSTRGI